MVNRKKRLKKGIKSIQRQIEIHNKKRSIAEDSENEGLVNYYNKEIEAKKRAKEKKEAILEKQ